MKTKLFLVFAILLVSVGAFASPAPRVDARINTDTTARQIRDAKGPMRVTFQIAVSNRSNAPVTLTRVEVRTDDASGLTIRDGSKKVNTVIAPSATENVVLVAKHLAPRGLSQSEPLGITVRLTFNGPGGKFIKEYSEFIR